MNENTPKTKKQKLRTFGAAAAVPLVLAGASAGAIITTANAADNTTATATETATQARTENAVTATLANFTGKAPSETVQNYVHWTFNDSDLPQRSDTSRTVYTVNVADFLKGIDFKPETLVIGAGATNSSAETLDLPLYATGEGSQPRSGDLTLGSGKESTTIHSNTDGTIVIPRNDDSLQKLTFLYSVETKDGKTITQRITFNPSVPKAQQGAVTADTTIGQLGTTSENPTEVKVSDTGDVTFTYTNKSEVVATTAAGSSITDGKIHLSMTRDGAEVQLEEVEIQPGETKTITVQNVKASGTAGEVTGSEFKVIEKVPLYTEPIRVAPCDHLAASPISLDTVGQGSQSALAAFSKLFFSSDTVRAAAITPAGANVETYTANTDASAYTTTNSCGTALSASALGNFGAFSATNQYTISTEKTFTYDYSVYVKPVETVEPTPTPEPAPSETPTPVPTPTVEPTPEPTPTTPEVTPEPSAPVTPTPVPSEPTVTPSESPTPSVTPSESTPPAPTQEATTPAPSVTPSEPSVEKPSEPGKPVQAKTGHESQPDGALIALIAGLAALAGGSVFLLKKARANRDKKNAGATGESTPADSEATEAVESESAVESAIETTADSVSDGGSDSSDGGSE